MNLYVVNIGLIVGVVMLLGLVTSRLVGWKERQIHRELIEQTFEELASERGLHWVASFRSRYSKPPLVVDADEPSGGFLEGKYLAEKYEKYLSEKHLRRARAVTRLVRVLNFATTLVALIPIGFAVYNLFTNNQTQALAFNLAALVTLVVTKGGLFILTWVLLPAVKAVPGAVAGAVVQKKVSEWMGEKKKN